MHTHLKTTTRTTNSLPVIDFPIFILVSKIKHLVNILLFHRYWQVPHHELEINLGEEFVLDFVLLCPEVCGVGVSTTYYLEIKETTRAMFGAWGLIGLIRYIVLNNVSFVKLYRVIQLN